MLKIVGEDVVLDSVITYKQNLEIFGSHISIDKGVYLSTNVMLGSCVHLSPYEGQKLDKIFISKLGDAK